MGWNRGYSIYEETVIAVYDTAAMTKELLDAVMRPYKGTDIDTGGCMGLTSHDGLSADEIVCKIMDPERYAEIITLTDGMPECVHQKGPDVFVIDGLEGYEYATWQEAVGDKRDSAVADLWFEITRREWDIW